MQRPLDDQLCFALYSATTAVVRTYRPLLAALGLTYPQYLVLLTLWQHGPLRTGELGQYLSLPAHGLAPVVRRLERAGLVRRESEPQDRRAARIVLTPEGEQLRGPALAAQREVVCATGLEPAQFAELRTTLQSLAAALHAGRPAVPHERPVATDRRWPATTRRSAS